MTLDGRDTTIVLGKYDLQWFLWKVLASDGLPYYPAFAHAMARGEYRCEATRFTPAARRRNAQASVPRAFTVGRIAVLPPVRLFRRRI